MDTLTRLKDLSSHMDFEPAEDHGCPKLDSSKNPGFVHNAVMPNGKSIPLLKTLLTSACERDCYYCPFRAGRDFRRSTLKPDEMANIFMAMHRAGIAEGLFLSSGIIRGGIHHQHAGTGSRADTLRRRNWLCRAVWTEPPSDRRNDRSWKSVGWLLTCCALRSLDRRTPGGHWVRVFPLCTLLRCGAIPLCAGRSRLSALGRANTHRRTSATIRVRDRGQDWKLDFRRAVIDVGGLSSSRVRCTAVRHQRRIP